MSANIKASVDGTQAIIGVGGVDQMTVSNAGVVTANSFVGAISGNASSATALATGSTTARTLANRFADVVNVKDFGAVGDGVADDTAAIQNAINLAQNSYNPLVYGSNSPANGSCVVFIPSGFYKITSELIVTKKITILGEGQSEFSSGSRLLQNNPNKDIIRVEPIASGISFAIEKMVLRHNGTGTGIMVNVTKTSAYCNSQRYVDCTFGPPASVGARIIGDDVVFQNCLFDVSNTVFIQLGTNTLGESCSNVRIVNCDFYQPTYQCILLYNVTNLTITGCTIWGDAPFNTYFLDGYNTLPTKIDNISVTGCTFKRVRSIMALSNSSNVTITGCVGSELGVGTGEILGTLSFYGTTTNVVISGNSFSGSYDTSSFYKDNGNIANNVNITGNVFTNTGGTGRALSTILTSGVINSNAFNGFVSPSVSEKVQTTVFVGGKTLSASGTVGDADAHNVGIPDAKEYDHVEISWPSIPPFTTQGVFTYSRVSSTGIAQIVYVNPTASSKAVTQHTLFVTVSRGV